MTPTPNPDLRLKFNPYDEQRDVLESDARFRVVAAGRRSGKTIMAAVETVRRAITGGDDWRGYWVGAEHQHSKTAFRLIDSAIPEELVARRNQSPPRTIELTTGASIEFHTAGGGALVSVGLDWAVCDEAGKNFPERSWSQELRPALSDRDGQAMFISTPDGRGWFFERYQRGQSPDSDEWKSWRWPSYRNPHVDDSEIDAAKNDVPDRIFRQEFMAEFIDETGGVFEGLDERLFTADYDSPQEGIAPYSIGADLARHQDYRVIIVVDGAGSVVYFDRERGETWPEIQREIEQVADDYPGIVSIDASRDNKLVGDLERAGVRIEPVTFGGGTKQDLIENLIATIEGGELEAPEIDVLRHELEVFEYDVTRAGNVTYDAPEGFHDDTIDALALAVDGMSKTHGAATATASVGRDDPDDSAGLDEIVAQQTRDRFNGGGWK